LTSTRAPLLPNRAVGASKHRCYCLAQNAFVPMLFFTDQSVLLSSAYVLYDRICYIPANVLLSTSTVCNFMMMLFIYLFIYLFTTYIFICLF
jgi:hypothetical protein